MRAYSTPQPYDLVPVQPDAKQVLLIAGSSGQAMDWPTGANIVRFSGVSTAGATLNFHVNLESTLAAIPSSGSTASTAASSGITTPVMGERTLQIPRGSTGWSVAAHSSGYITAEVWKR